MSLNCTFRKAKDVGHNGTHPVIQEFGRPKMEESGCSANLVYIVISKSHKNKLIKNLKWLSQMVNALFYIYFTKINDKNRGQGDCSVGKGTCHQV